MEQTLILAQTFIPVLGFTLAALWLISRPGACRAVWD